MTNFSKKYVEVVVRFREDGLMLPRAILWDDGRRYEIDRVLNVCRAASLRAGGQGDRYTIRVRGKDTYLFFEHSPELEDERPGRWFVEALEKAISC